IRGLYEEHKVYGPQLELANIRPVNDADRTDGFELTQFVESSRFDRAAMFAELRGLAESQIADKPLRRLVLLLLDRHADPLQNLPATQRHFFPFCGGLIEHILSVTKNCLFLVDKYSAHYCD